MPDLKINPNGGAISTSVVIEKQHVGTTAIDLWDDNDHNGAPDDFLKRVKNPGDKENLPIELGSAAELDGKVVQWIWMPSQPPMATDGWQVLIDVRQDGKSLADMPMRLAGDYPAGKQYGLYDTWYRLVSE